MLALQKKILLKVLQFFLYAESAVTIFIVLMIIKFDCFGIDITFNFTDCMISYDFQNREEPIKYLRNCTYTLGLNKKCFLEYYFMKYLQEF